MVICMFLLYYLADRGRVGECKPIGCYHCRQLKAWWNISVLEALQNCDRFHEAQMSFGKEF